MALPQKKHEELPERVRLTYAEKDDPRALERVAELIAELLDEDDTER